MHLAVGAIRGGLPGRVGRGGSITVASLGPLGKPALRTHASEPAVNLVASASKSVTVRSQRWPKQFVLGGRRLNLLKGMETMAKARKAGEAWLREVLQENR